MSYKIYEHDGVQYHCGCKPRLHFGLLKAYATVTAQRYTLQQVLEQIAQRKATLAPWVWFMLNQGSYGDCWAYAEIGALMSKLDMMFGDKTLLDPSTSIVLTGQYNGGAIDSAIAQVFSVIGVPEAEFMGSDPRMAKTLRRKADWPEGWERNSSLRKVPDGEWSSSYDRLELAGSIIDGNPSIVGVNWQGGGHALQCVEVRTPAAISAVIQGASDKVKQQFDSLDDATPYREEDTGKLKYAGPCINDLGSSSELLFAGPNSWGLGWASGWGSYPGRPGWWLLSGDSAAMRETFSRNGFGTCILHGAQDLDVKPVPETKKAA